MAREERDELRNVITEAVGLADRGREILRVREERRQLFAAKAEAGTVSVVPSAGVTRRLVSSTRGDGPVSSSSCAA